MNELEVVYTLLGVLVVILVVSNIWLYCSQDSGYWDKIKKIPEEDKAKIIAAVKELEGVVALSELEKLEKELELLQRRKDDWDKLSSLPVSRRTKPYSRDDLFKIYNQIELRLWSEERIHNGIIETTAKIAELENTNGQ
jgi:hypothetical protein